MAYNEDLTPQKGDGRSQTAQCSALANDNESCEYAACTWQWCGVKGCGSVLNKTTDREPTTERMQASTQWICNY